MEDNKLVDLGHGDSEDVGGRSRNWFLLLYPDNEDMNKILESRLDDLDWNYCGRVHDKDEGVKEHHHVLVCFVNGRLKADVASDLGIDERWLRRVHSQKKAMRYLCHRDNPEKYQYSPDGIYGTLADKAIAQCQKGDKVSEVDGTMKVAEIINGWPGIVSVTKVLPVICAEGVYSHYRRLGNSIFKMIEEHNKPFYDFAEKQRQANRDSEDIKEKFQKLESILHSMSFDEYLEWRKQKGFSNDPTDII